MPGCPRTFGWFPPRARADFHARFDATGKQYRYFVWRHPAMNPLIRLTAWHVPRSLDLRPMRIAARLFVGKHDFSSFTARSGHERETPVRTLTRVEIQSRGPLLTFINGPRLCISTRVKVRTGVSLSWPDRAVKELKSCLPTNNRAAIRIGRKSSERGTCQAVSRIKGFIAGWRQTKYRYCLPVASKRAWKSARARGGNHPNVLGQPGIEG